MDITIPAIPAGMLTLLAFFAPFAIAIINSPVWPPVRKRVVAIIVSVLLAGIVIALYYLMTGDLLPSWPAFLLLAIVVVQAAYTVVYRQATELERTRGTGSHLDR